MDQEKITYYICEYSDGTTILREVLGNDFGYGSVYKLEYNGPAIVRENADKTCTDIVDKGGAVLNRRKLVKSRKLTKDMFEKYKTKVKRIVVKTVVTKRDKYFLEM